jgi:hypothetical protein
MLQEETFSVAKVLQRQTASGMVIMNTVMSRLYNVECLDYWLMIIVQDFETRGRNPVEVLFQ